MKIFLTMSIFFLLVSCQNQEIDSGLIEQEDFNEATLAKLFYGKIGNAECEFEYSGNLGPDNWSAICGTDWVDCSGNHQSPINIVTSAVMEDDDLEELEFDYNVSSTKIINNGHTLQFDYVPGSWVEIDGKSYELKQFHFHTSSEHTFDGASFPLEVHLVHRDPSTGLLAVIGVLFEISNKDNLFLSEFINHLPENKGGTYTSSFTYNALAFLNYEDELEDFYHYSGSLTTPPCSEIVFWYVSKKRLKISWNQLQIFKNIMHTNNRPAQLLNGRNVFTPEL